MISLYGPFDSLISLQNLPTHGVIKEKDVKIQKNHSILVNNGLITSLDKFDVLYKKYKNEKDLKVINVPKNCLVIPGFVDCHTHICFAGSRVNDYSLRCEGKSYLEIASSGGGIINSVNDTRLASIEKLQKSLLLRIKRLVKNGITTVEIKSGYGLNVKDELKILNAINIVNNNNNICDIIPTCLAAHIKPIDFIGDNTKYLTYILNELLPIVKLKKLANRVDIFVDIGAFNLTEAEYYIKKAKDMGFAFTIHADQFSTGGAKLAIKLGAASADHLEVLTNEDIKLFKESNTIAVCLPGASFGLGMLNLTPARKLLDQGASLAIASDWNPGSAPMGNLIVQAAIFGACEKLSIIETLAAITYRASLALGLKNRGRLAKNMIADFQIYDTTDYRDIFYNQGELKPSFVYKNGNLVYKTN